MKVKLGQAVKMFFSNSSLEMIYFEAIGNSLDAGATDISIDISMTSYKNVDSLVINISDNGEGFNDARYKKFSNLFDVEESSHKGLGRLVYLFYFNQIKINSVYSEVAERVFTFSDNFEECDCEIKTIKNKEKGSVLSMSGYTLKKISKTDYLSPISIKKRILEEFYSRLFKYSEDGTIITININSKIGTNIIKEKLSNSEIPVMKRCVLEQNIDLFNSLELYYSIEEVDPIDTSFISAISVDNRSFKCELIAKEYKPTGYKMVFLLFSDYFIGKVDAARQNLTLTQQEFKEIQYLFRRKVTSLIEAEIPRIKLSNEVTKEKLINRYPHLNGYFDIENIGYIKRDEILKNAQDEFFKAQKEILDAQELTDAQFEKSLEISARALTEYIIFRQLTIEKLRSSTVHDSEAVLHDIIASKGKEGRFDKANLVDDIFKNNSWLLDDKFMTYEVTLSDREMTELVTFLVDGEEVERDIDRPDLAFIFSNNPNDNKPFDVVIVELKKRGLNVYENLKTVNQLETRARNLMKYYNNKVQRIWYYGIIEFNEEIELALASDFTQLYSCGKLYYNQKDVAIAIRPEKITVPVSLFMWDIDAVIQDADARNNTFLKFIRSKFTSQ